MIKISKASLLLLLAQTIKSDECSTEPYLRTDCGYVGINQQICEQKGCCWSPASGGNFPWCFTKGSSNVCNNFIFTADSPGFDQTFYQGMIHKFESQINYDGTGAVEASPDRNTKGGDYFYDWMRDGALSMRTYQEVNYRDLPTIQKTMDSYVAWVSKLQTRVDPFGQDVRAEPKFFIPSGEVYSGGWCRPQQDGPALRAYTLIMYAETLKQNGKDYSTLWNSNGGLIKNDIEYVLTHWTDTTCDLWEEIRSSDFFWNLMAYRHSLSHASQFALSVNDSALSDRCQAQMRLIEKQIDTHWNGDYLWNDKQRMVDGSVLHAIVSFEGYIGLSDPRVLKTIDYYNKVFCSQYQINQIDTANNIPGNLWGRYPGDNYAGGNPWQLLTSTIAEYYYKAALQLLENKITEKDLTQENLSLWMKITNLPSPSSTSIQLAQSLLQAGDSIMTRIFHHVQNSDYQIDEQIDRNTGVQTNAKSLTWSYANLVRALNERLAVVA